MNIIINNINFDAKSYYYNQDGISIYISSNNTTIRDIENAASNLATIQINNQEIMDDMILESITHEYNKDYYNVIFRTQDIQTQVNTLKGDIAYIKTKLQEILSKIDSNNGG